MIEINVTVNYKKYTLLIKPNSSLLEILREDLGLTGTKEGCGVGECGACTVIMNGKTVNACMVLAPETDKCEILTIEGLAAEVEEGRLHPVQEAFIEAGGMQCGFCTPGMIMSVKAMLDANPDPSDEEIRKGLEGNFCRCTGYTKIFDSVKLAGRMIRGEK